MRRYWPPSGRGASRRASAQSSRHLLRSGMWERGGDGGGHAESLSPGRVKKWGLAGDRWEGRVPGLGWACERERERERAREGRCPGGSCRLTRHGGPTVWAEFLTQCSRSASRGDSRKEVAVTGWTGLGSPDGKAGHGSVLSRTAGVSLAPRWWPELCRVPSTDFGPRASHPPPRPGPEHEPRVATSRAAKPSGWLLAGDLGGKFGGSAQIKATSTCARVDLGAGPVGRREAGPWPPQPASDPTARFGLTCRIPQGVRD